MKIVHFSFLFMLNMVLCSSIQAQTFQLATDTATTITVTGTSTLHGWTVAVNEVQDVPTTLTLSGENENTVDSFAFGVVINSMDGGRGASMNAKITNALQAATHPVISYQQNESAVISEVDDAGNFTLISKGLLKMVGMEKAIEIEVMGQKTDSGIILKGSKPLKFSEFDIEPPSAMFGQIVCGDDIAVNFEFRYQK
ncbi:MAG: YceI family protein [Saprospiraceae bacterium]